MTAEPQNAAITRVDGRFEITPEVDGKTVDTEATKTALETALADTDAEAVSYTHLLFFHLGNLIGHRDFILS